jgi:dTDP-glucose 4,6-dehydratase
MSKKILITGATGFIGSHLTELLVEQGCNVVAFDRYNSNSHWGCLENSKYINDIEVVLGDIRDYDSVSKAMQGCDVVFHLAALIGIPYSYISPLAYIRTNVEGAYNVLEAAKNLNLEQVLITSTLVLVAEPVSVNAGLAVVVDPNPGVQIVRVLCLQYYGR